MRNPVRFSGNVQNVMVDIEAPPTNLQVTRQLSVREHALMIVLGLEACGWWRRAENIRSSFSLPAAEPPPRELSALERELAERLAAEKTAHGDISTANIILRFYQLGPWAVPAPRDPMRDWEQRAAIKAQPTPVMNPAAAPERKSPPKLSNGGVMNPRDVGRLSDTTRKSRP